MENIPTAYGVEVAYPGHEEELLSQGCMEACVSVSATLCQVTPILIVDDDPDIREALSDRLVLEGYTAQAVGTGGEAIQKVRHERYGAVLLDIGLPDINGLSVLKILTELDSKLPVIVITAQTTEENKVGSLRKGAFAYLAKPFNLEEVRATVRRAVAGKALAVKAEDVEHAWRESEERFRCVVESATDAIVLADAGGNIISWNRAAEGLFGYAEHEVMGQPLTILMPMRYREAHQRGLERGRHEVAGVEHDFRDGDGRRDGGVLDQLAAVVAERRQGDTQHLRQQHAAQHLRRREADGQRGFALAGVQGPQPGREDVAQHGGSLRGLGERSQCLSDSVRRRRCHAT